MILSDATNLQKHSSLLDLRKLQLPRCESSPSTELFSCYFSSIFQTCKSQIENILYPYSSPSDPLFLARNSEIEWMFSVQLLMNVDDDTLFQAILYFDKYISLKWKQLTPNLVSKAAAACLILSSKINEIYYIKLHKLNHLSRFTLTSAEYVELEMEILNLFDFSLPHTTIL